MSSEIVLKCWLCPDSFARNRDLKDHTITKHAVCKMVCPWCWEEEKLFARMSELAKHAKRKHTDLTLDLLEGDFFTEKNGFWLALRPVNYARIITPGDWEAGISIRTRAALLGWVGRCKGATRTRMEWEAGWREAMEMETPAPTPRKRKYSPSAPSIDYPTLDVQRISLTSKTKVAFLRMVEVKAEVWFKVEFVHWIVEDRKAMDNLLRRMALLKEDRDPPKEFSTELKTEDAKFTLRQVATKLGIGERHVRRLFRGTIKFDNLQKDQQDIGDEPQYEIMDTFEDPEPTEQAESEREVMVEEEHAEGEKVVVSDEQETEKDAQESESRTTEADETNDVLVEDETAEKGHEEHMRICGEEEPDIKYRAEKLLLRGGMPMFPPGRREWGEQQVIISLSPTEMLWPPRDWTKLSGEERLTSWRFAAMTLERENGATSCTNEGYLLDKYAMLALPGTPVGKTIRKGETAARTANYKIITSIAAGKLEGKEAEEWVKMFETATSNHLQDTHPLVDTIKDIPLRITCTSTISKDGKEQTGE